MTQKLSASRSLIRFASSLALAAGIAVLGSGRAEAQDSASINLAQPALSADGASQSNRKVYRPLMIVGATLFVGSYAPSVAFATLGDWNADDALLVPVAGPWMALANPENEPLSKALLINSGVMQGVGVLSMVASMLIPNYGQSTTLRFGKNELQVAPTQLSRDGYGVGAAGSF